MSTSRPQVLDAFERLVGRVGNGDVPALGYTVEAISADRLGLYLGCSESGELALIVETRQSRTPPAPLRLVALSADFGVRSELRDGDDTKTVRVSVLRCSVLERGVGDLFATLCASFVDTLPSDSTEQEFANEINRWSGLFWRLGRRVDTDIVGLAGELAVIASAPHPSVWVQAWHADPGDVLDFVFADAATSVEVKSTRGTTREHVVSLGQVLSEGMGERFFASVFVELNDSARPLGDLVREVSDRLDDEGRLAFWSVLTDTCGEGLEEVLTRRFEDSKAMTSLRFYDAGDIPVPVVDLPLPQGVSSVSFKSKFDLAEHVDRAAVEAGLYPR